MLTSELIEDIAATAEVCGQGKCATSRDLRALRSEHGHRVSVYRDGVDDLHERDSNAQPNELANPWPIASVSVSLAVGGTSWASQLPGTIKTAVPTSSKA